MVNRCNKCKERLYPLYARVGRSWILIKPYGRKLIEYCPKCDIVVQITSREMLKKNGN